MEASQQPTAEELAQAGQVSAAGAEAIAGSETKDEARENADKAIKDKAHEVNFKLSDEDRHALVDELIERLSSLGAFDPPPPPEQTTPPPAAAEQAAAAEAAVAAAPPEKRSFAERFAGT